MGSRDRLILAGIVAAAVLVLGVAARRRQELDARRTAEAERYRARAAAYFAGPVRRPQVSTAGILISAGMGAASGALACASAGPWGVAACGIIGAGAGGVTNYAQQRKGIEQGQRA